MNKNVRKLGYFFILIFVAQLIFLGYINFYLGPVLATNPYNRRLAAEEAGIRRGAIYDRNGIVLARDVEENGKRKRSYPLGQSTSQLLGFVSEQYGRTGLESQFDTYLLALDDAGSVDKLINRIFNRPSYGYNVYLTLDANLQKKAVTLLGNRRGAVVALDPKTGAVLALASTPGYDPNKIERVIDRKTEKYVENGKTLTREVKVTYFDLIKKDNENSPLLNRATFGMYSPGSTFKLITGAGVLSENAEITRELIKCDGSITVDGFVLKDTKAHGIVDFNDALRVSCNTAFARYGLLLGEKGLKKSAGAFGFVTDGSKGQGKDRPVAGQDRLSPIDFNYISYNPGTLPGGSYGKTEIASTAIGQGRVMASPMQMALVAAGIANNGVIMSPYVLNEVKTVKGTVRDKAAPRQLYAAMTPEIAARLTTAMEAVVSRGTATAAAINGIRVAGKTGSAQNPGGETHAWFVGFAPAGNPSIAVAVVLENAGAGGKEAAPVAREVMAAYLQ